MREEHGKFPSGTLSDDLALYGMITGSCHVPSGRHLDLYGMVAGDLIVDEGGSADVHGMIAGSVRADGRVDLAGMVAGRAAGPGLTIRSGSYINGVEQRGQYGPTADYGKE